MKYKTPNHFISDHKGLSLAEILISLSILAFFSVAVVNITQDSIGTKERIVSEDKEKMLVERAINRIMEDFSNLYSPLSFSAIHRPSKTGYPGEENDNLLLNERRTNQMYLQSTYWLGPTYSGHPVPKIVSPSKEVFQFFTTANVRKFQDSKQSTFAWIRYEVKNNESDEGPGELSLIRYLINENIYDPDSAINNVRPYILMKNLKSFEFHFWDPRSKRFVENLREAQNGELKIQALKIKLTWVRKSGIEEEEERLFTPLWPVFEPEDIAELKNKLSK